MREGAGIGCCSISCHRSCTFVPSEGDRFLRHAYLWRLQIDLGGDAFESAPRQIARLFISGDPSLWQASGTSTPLSDCRRIAPYHRSIESDTPVLHVHDASLLGVWLA